MKKITFLVLHLGYGGAEKAIASQANMLSKKYEVEIISTYKLFNTPPFYINKDVKITYLLEDKFKPNKDEFRMAIKNKNAFKIVKEGIKSIKILYLRRHTMSKAISKCESDIIISSRVLYNKILTDKCKTGTVCIAQEHNHHNNNEKYINKIVSSIKHMDYYMPVSQELTSFYADRIKDTKTKCVYIPHCLDEIPEVQSKLNEKNLISVGRISKEKGFIDLIEVFNKVSKKNNDWILNIVGDGEERTSIENKIKELKLENKVILHGFRDKEYINELLSKSSIYIMTSFKESFGIVLLEAQSFGIPCVAFDSARGATEIIHDGIDGIFVEDRNIEEMAKSIDKLINDEELRKRYGENGRKNSFNYSFNNIQQKWFEFIETTGRQ